MSNTVTILCWSFLLLIVGYFLPAIKSKSVSRTFAWVLVATTILGVIQFSLDQVPVIRMIIIVSLLLLSVKVVVYNETYVGESRLNFIQWSVFAIGWFGMRPMLF